VIFATSQPLSLSGVPLTKAHWLLSRAQSQIVAADRFALT